MIATIVNIRRLFRSISLWYDVTVPRRSHRRGCDDACKAYCIISQPIAFIRHNWIAKECRFYYINIHSITNGHMWKCGSLTSIMVVDVCGIFPPFSGKCLILMQTPKLISEWIKDENSSCSKNSSQSIEKFRKKLETF